MYEPKWHPLQQVDNFAPLQWWEEFVFAWEHNRHPEVFMTLLDLGFKLSMNKYDRDDNTKHSNADRWAFYLNVAESHDRLAGLEMEQDGLDVTVYGVDGRRVQRSISEFRREVARKAFKVLCHQLSLVPVIEVGRSQKTNSDWKTVITSPSLYPALQYFLRAEEVGHRMMRIEFPNLPYQIFTRDEMVEEREWLWSFIENLAEFVWVRSRSVDEVVPTNEQELGLHRAWIHLLDESKTWLVKLFLAFGHGDELRQWFPLHPTCLRLLSEIAMNKEIKWPGCDSSYGERKVRDLDEALYSGSQAARVLSAHAIFMKVERRRAVDAKRLRNEREEKLRRTQQERARQEAEKAKAMARALGVKV